MADASLELDVLIEDDRWTVLPGCEDLAERAIRAAYAHAAFSEPCSLCLLLADDARLRALNRDYRGKDRPTNVLSFPIEGNAPPGGARPLGDIALAYETLAREAVDADRPFSDHFQHLIVHGSLHLIGYTHEAAREAERMESLEIAVLARLGVPNPYESGARQQMVRNVNE